ncbi:MAG TPA: hypothetical protein PLF30_00220 [Candidatus Moranbacteria bacterium]|jgi:hypothetical protein|nr:hypothetical protein [Candidatus Moranbacteria bacterium]HPX93979.1 hypothetical protein [Candidatus Moranbacteria bacterium]HQB59294.1 hypothetical protein [Candidatus Moranbacteria bacterium]
MAAYKLLNNLLLLLLIAFTGTIFAESLLPGIITSQIGFTSIASAILLTMLALIWIGNKYQIRYEKLPLRKTRIVPILAFVSFLLLGNSMLKFDLWENIIITMSVLFFMLLLYQQIFEAKK